MNHTIAEDLKRRLIGAGRCVVFVCGLPGSGKSTFCVDCSAVTGLTGPVLHSDWYAKYATNVRRARIAEALASGTKQMIEAEEDPRNWYDWDGLIRDLAI